MQASQNINKLTDHLFRHESGKMVAVLTKIFGTANLETAEDVVQQTFIDAIGVWKMKGVPDNPSAWLFRVAKNKTIDIIRKNKHAILFDFNDHDRKLLASEYTLSSTIENLWKEDVIKDDMLSMMFACCHPGISIENQVTLILKTLCGFSTTEIAKAFITSEDTVSKRLYRTRTFFRNEKVKLSMPSEADIKSRISSVLNSIYLLFNEGYNSTQSEQLIRSDLIDEAMILCKLLTENPATQLPEVFALMALMCFHAARSESRLTAAGEIILMAYQDRTKWNAQLIGRGIGYIDRAAMGEEISSYHLEAAIAYEHCTARNFSSTNWKRILELYQWLCQMASSPVAELNRSIAVMQVYGPAKALESVGQIPDQKKLQSFYLYQSLLGEIYTRMGQTLKAIPCFEQAIELTRSGTEKKMLKDKIIALRQ